jgi:5S rRNA maturation endonuclease (ribonuclease M5)
MENPDLNAWLDRLKESEKLIIVEGFRDRNALAKLGIDKIRIFVLNMPIFALTELVASRTKKVIILTDLDAQGKKLYSKLKQDLTAHGIEVDNYFREFLFRNTKLTHIEGIATYFEHHTD